MSVSQQDQESQKAGRSRKPESVTITIEEAAAILGVGRSAASIAARAGEIPAIRCGKQTRIPKEALLLQLSGNRGVDGEGVVSRLEEVTLESRLAELDAQRAEIERRLIEVRERRERQESYFERVRRTKK